MKGRARPIIVQKYGGSSVADVEKLGKVADRIVACRNSGSDVVVVVSASRVFCFVVIVAFDTPPADPYGAPPTAPNG